MLPSIVEKNRKQKTETTTSPNFSCHPIVNNKGSRSIAHEVNREPIYVPIFYNIIIIALLLLLSFPAVASKHRVLSVYKPMKESFCPFSLQPPPLSPPHPP